MFKGELGQIRGLGCPFFNFSGFQFELGLKFKKLWNLGSVRTILWNFRFCRIFREKPGILIPQNHRLSPVNNSAESIKAQNGRAAKPRNPTRKRRKKHRINSQARRTCERTHPKASSRESGASNQARDTCPQAR